MQLSGVHVVRSKGRAYHYAWRGGPRLPGTPGSPEYIAAFHEAHAARKRPQTGTLRQAIVTYRASAAYEALSAPTTRAYGAHLDLIQAKFGDAPFKVVGDRRFRAYAMDWRDTMRKTPRQADYAMGTFKRLLDHCIDRGHIETNPLAEVKRLYKGNRADSIWTADEVERFNATASPELRWVLALAIFTGLRQKDLVALPWGAYDSKSFTLHTSKSGGKRRVLVPATVACRAVMAQIPKRQLVVLTTNRGGRRWTQDGLRASFRAACERAEVKRTFHDLRRTAATNLLLCGLNDQDVAAILGWGTEEIEALKRVYVSRAAIIEGVLAKLEKGG